MMEKLKKQLKALMYELTVEIPKQLEFARSLGDLSDNAEYKMTKERQLYVESRIKQVEELVTMMRGINLENLPADRIAYGSRVTVEDIDSGELRTFVLVFDGETPDYQQPGDVLVTVGSPIAQSLFGKREGNDVRVRLPKGSFEWEIIEIQTFPELIEKNENE